MDNQLLALRLVIIVLLFVIALVIIRINQFTTWMTNFINWANRLSGFEGEIRATPKAVQVMKWQMILVLLMLLGTLLISFVG